MKIYEGMITKLGKNEVFVFGSNPLGVNGNPKRRTGGAALWALENAGVKQGEKMDNKLSNSKKAYGIVTVTKPGARRSLSSEEIIANIKLFYTFARKNRQLKFLLAYTHSGKTKTLNGYSGSELKKMFKKASPRIPSNIYFNKNFMT